MHVYRARTHEIVAEAHAFLAAESAEDTTRDRWREATISGARCAEYEWVLAVYELARWGLR